MNQTRLQLAMTCPRYQESGESLVCMTPASEGKDVSITLNTYIVSLCKKEICSSNHQVLVPLTGSMYVPGLLTQPEKVVVDIGTGYYVEKDSTAAQEYFNRKVKFVTENMERVQAIGNEKAKIRCSASASLNMRLLFPSLLYKSDIFPQGAGDGRDAGEVEGSVQRAGGGKGETIEDLFTHLTSNRLISVALINLHQPTACFIIH